MTQNERRIYLLKALMRERGENTDKLPKDSFQQRQLLRAMMNKRMPAPVSEEFLQIQDAYLQQAIAEKGITKLSDLVPMEKDIYLWQGDITTLSCDAIVNAANSQMLGCFRPLHNCIDNCIHTYAGIALRNCCNEMMMQQGHEEPTGKAKITPAYNLPCQYVLHTVGPIVQGCVTLEDSKQLKSCYYSCLALADEYRLNSIAFCCISTGVFGFPKKEAAQIAIESVKEFKALFDTDIKVIFNVFNDKDYRIYQELLH